MKNMKKYSGVLLATAVVVGGVTSATFDFSTLPGADKIKAGQTIKANDILALSHALTSLDLRTNGTAPTADTDLVNKGFLDTQIGDLGGKTVQAYVDANFTSDKIIFNGIEYGTIRSVLTGKKWLDRNIGASQVCTSLVDEACYGDYIQWGRPLDEHEKFNSITDNALVSSIVPTHSSFITPQDSPYDWTTADSDKTLRSAFMAKTDGTGVCPLGYRVPTEAELTAENFTNLLDMFTRLKIPEAGYRHNKGAKTYGQGAVLWSSNVDADNTNNWIKNLFITSTSSSWRSSPPSSGFSVRCIED